VSSRNFCAEPPLSPAKQSYTTKVLPEIGLHVICAAQCGGRDVHIQNACDLAPKIGESRVRFDLKSFWQPIPPVTLEVDTLLMVSANSKREVAAAPEGLLSLRYAGNRTRQDK
jgi:hypothetical protein